MPKLLGENHALVSLSRPPGDGHLAISAPAVVLDQMVRRFSRIDSELPVALRLCPPLSPIQQRRADALSLMHGYNRKLMGAGHMRLGIV